MNIAQVIGTVTLGHYEAALKSGRFLLVSPLNGNQLREFYQQGRQTPALSPLSGELTAVVYDELGAGMEDIIGYVEGAEATAPFDHPIPIDTYNAAILDKAYYEPPTPSLAQ